MPTYEYRCPDGHDFEKFVQKISLASSELPCPVCGKIAQRRISAGAGLVFKGSGFYITDYGKDGKKDLRANAASASSIADKPSAGGKAEGGSSGDHGSKTDGGASGDRASKSENGSSSASGGKSDSAKSESPKAESAKPSPKPSGPAAPKSGSSDK
ncbi:MAG: FmdB family zinc ribbon protein [Gemmatimonadales bacterium]